MRFGHVPKMVHNRIRKIESAGKNSVLPPNYSWLFAHLGWLYPKHPFGFDAYTFVSSLATLSIGTKIDLLVSLFQKRNVILDFKYT